MVTLTLIDETGFGNKTLEKKQDFSSSSLSLRDLIRERIFAEVADYNAKQPHSFQGLVQPSETEQSLNGFKLKKPRLLNAENQLAKALALFDDRGFLVLINDEQIDDLDCVIDLANVDSVSFLKLVPLIGG